MLDYKFKRRRGNEARVVPTPFRLDPFNWLAGWILLAMCACVVTRKTGVTRRRHGSTRHHTTAAGKSLSDIDVLRKSTKLIFRN